MKGYLSLRFISVFIIVLFVFNIFSLTFDYKKENTLTKIALVEHFFSTVNFPTDIISKMVKSKTAPQNMPETDNKIKLKIKEYVLSLNILSFTEKVSSVYNKLLSFCIGSNNIFAENIEYPLKIPFWRSIILLLLMRLLFNILPRSVSIKYSVKYMGRACIV